MLGKLLKRKYYGKYRNSWEWIHINLELHGLFMSWSVAHRAYRYLDKVDRNVQSQFFQEQFGKYVRRKGVIRVRKTNT